MNCQEAINALFEGKKIKSKKTDEIFLIYQTPMGKFVFTKGNERENYFTEVNSNLFICINSEYEVVE